MPSRLVITLEPMEREALGKLAKRELRDPRDQIRMILRRALESENLLNTEAESKTGTNGDNKN